MSRDKAAEQLTEFRDAQKVFHSVFKFIQKINALKIFVSDKTRVVDYFSFFFFL